MRGSDRRIVRVVFHPLEFAERVEQRQALRERRVHVPFRFSVGERGIERGAGEFQVQPVGGAFAFADFVKLRPLAKHLLGLDRLEREFERDEIEIGTHSALQKHDV